MGSKKLNVGVVGCGMITKTRHLPAYKKLSKLAKVVALADLNVGVAKSLAKLYNVKSVYRSIDHMLSNESLDLVDICTPPKTHREMALEAMRSGVHVLTEKPMATSVKECEEMAKCARDNNVKLSVIHQMLYYPSMRKAFKMVRRGDIGDVKGVHIFMSEPRQTEWLKPDSWAHRLPGGLVGETGPHVAYLSLPFVGRPTKVDVNAMKSPDCPWTPFVEYQILIQGDKGYSLATLSYTSTRRLHVIQIVGSKGSIYADLNSMVVYKGSKLDLNIMEIGADRLRLATSIISGLVVNSVKVLFGQMKLGHEVFIEKYLRSILENRIPPVTPEEGTEAVRLMEMIVKSLKNHG